MKVQYGRQSAADRKYLDAFISSGTFCCRLQALRNEQWIMSSFDQRIQRCSASGSIFPLFRDSSLAGIVLNYEKLRYINVRFWSSRNVILWYLSIVDEEGNTAVKTGFQWKRPKKWQGMYNIPAISNRLFIAWPATSAFSALSLMAWLPGNFLHGRLDPFPESSFSREHFFAQRFF